MSKILLVDDDTMVRDLVRMALQPPHTLVEAADGEAAFALIEKERPDLIIVDWVLPGLSGVHILKRLQRTPGMAGIPVIISSARPEAQIQAVAREYHTNGYLSKPFDVVELRALVASVLQEQIND